MGVMTRTYSEKGIIILGPIVSTKLKSIAGDIQPFLQYDQRTLIRNLLRWIT